MFRSELEAGCLDFFYGGGKFRAFLHIDAGPGRNELRSLGSEARRLCEEWTIESSFPFFLRQPGCRAGNEANRALGRLGRPFGGGSKFPRAQAFILLLVEQAKWIEGAMGARGRGFCRGLAAEIKLPIPPRRGLGFFWRVEASVASQGVRVGGILGRGVPGAGEIRIRASA